MSEICLGCENHPVNCECGDYDYFTRRLAERLKECDTNERD